MKKTDLPGYLEFKSHLKNYSLNADFQDLLTAADESQIHTFGWPIGVVLHNRKEYMPNPISQKIIAAEIKNEKSYDYWSLNKNGEYYILKSLFEDRRSEGKIFFDTRTIRTAEVLTRTAKLYLALGVPANEEIICKLEYGGLLNRILTAANPGRAVTFSYDRKCTLNDVNMEFQEPLENFVNIKRLQEMVYETVKAITEGCEFFIPSKSQVIDPIVDEFLKGRII